MNLLQVKPSVALLVMVLALLAVALAASPAEAQTAGNGKYDTDGDRLIEITYLEQLGAMDVDDDGDGTVNSNASQEWKDYYANSFPVSEGERICFRACRGYELTRSLDFLEPSHYQSGVVNTDWTGGEGWFPNEGFAATFEGNGHTISNLYIYLPETSNVGLFGWTAVGSSISNVGLVDVEVTGQGPTGGLVGSNLSTITKTSVTGGVAGRGTHYSHDGTGGLVGGNWSGGTISESYSKADVTNVRNVTGGLVGANRGAVSTSYATGNVSGHGSVGGLVGSSALYGGTAHITSSYATGNVSGSSNYVGGLVGSGGSTYGIDDRTTITNSYAISRVSGPSFVGGLIAAVNTNYPPGSGTSSSVTIVTASYWDTETSGVDSSPGGEGKTTAELQSPDGYSGIYSAWGNQGDVWDFGNSNQYPALKADLDGDGVATAYEFGGQGHAPAPPPSCIAGIAVGAGTAGQWAESNDCPSVNKEGSYARYYTFNLSTESGVTITLESDDADTYLFLLEGSGTSGKLLYKDDDYPGGGTNSQIKETLPAGVYTIEATTYAAEQTGSFTLKVEPGQGTLQEPAPRCFSGIAVDGGAASGTWASDCPSVNKEGSYARYVAFSLAEETEVSITLESDDADTYLFLLEDYGASGAVLHKDDDYPGGGTNSQIKETLPAGVYTIEATTYEAEATGGFTLTVRKVVETPGRPGPGPTPPPQDDACGETVEEDGTRNGEWTSGCQSETREGRYARYYSFTLTQEREVTVTLRSGDADAYLYLRRGEARSGAALNDHADDDDAGGGSDAQAVETLPAGTYTVEATTHESGQTGSFTLTVSGLDSGAGSAAGDDCGEKLTADGEVSGAWAEGCDSEERDGRYARYYSFTLTGESDVAIVLERTSGEADTYLYLRAGDDARSGAFLYENDDDGGTAKSTIQADGLAAGSYTIEATTYEAGETGDFTLTVTGL